MKNNLRLCLIVLGTLIFIFDTTNAAAGRMVTNEEIHNTMLSLVHSYSLLDNKLERHENRERSLGELLKKSLLAVQRNQRVLTPLHDILGRLEERFSQIETLLLGQEERISESQSKLADALESVLKWMIENTRPPPIKEEISKVEARFDNSNEIEELDKKIDGLNENINKLRTDFTELKTIKLIDDAKTKKIFDETEKLVTLQMSMNTPEEYVSKIEEKLTHFYITNPVSTPAPIKEYNNAEWENKVESILGDLKTNLKEVKLLAANKEIEFDKKFFEELNNLTIQKIESARNEVIQTTDKSFAKQSMKFKESNEVVGNALTNVFEKLNETSKLSTEYFKGAKQDNEQLRETMKSLDKIDDILLKTRENVVDTKRRLEFGILQIISEVDVSVKENANDLNASMTKRFEELNQDVIANHNIILMNVTTKIESEMSQVWRQIGIMFQEISLTRSTLEKLQRYSEIYVNGTTHTVGEIEEKISSITLRIEEMYSNLNYLLGKLSLVNVEFNNIKTGLGAAIESLKEQFKIVQTNIQDLGPGPHKIPSAEIENDNIDEPKSNLVKRLALPGI